LTTAPGGQRSCYATGKLLTYKLVVAVDTWHFRL